MMKIINTALIYLAITSVSYATDFDAITVNGVALSMTEDRATKAFNPCRESGGSFDKKYIHCNSDHVVIDKNVNKVVEVHKHKEFDFVPDWAELRSQILDKYGLPTLEHSRSFNYGYGVTGTEKTVCYGSCKSEREDNGGKRAEGKNTGKYLTISFRVQKDNEGGRNILRYWLIDNEARNALHKRDSVAAEREEESERKRKTTIE